MNSDLLSEISIPKIPAQSNQLRGLGARDILLGLFVDVKYNVRINVIVVMSQTFLLPMCSNAKFGYHWSLNNEVMMGGA